MGIRASAISLNAFAVNYLFDRGYRKVSTTSEFAAIAAISSLLPGPADPAELWIGDDAAAVRGPEAGHWLLLAADTVVAGVHADLGLTTLEDLGWKAMVASVSDIAAMGGEPGHALVTVSGPPGTDLQTLYRGLAAASAEFDCPIVGGDLTNASDVVVTVAVTGYCADAPVRRSGARPGDLVWVTGPLGGSAAGLRLLQAGRDRGSAEPRLEPPQEAAVRAHARPRPLLASGRAARTAGATAMIDVSDGLLADLGHIADQSGVGFDLESVPVHPAATREEALAGGEDFQLVFCAPESAPVGDTFAGSDTPILIGRCTTDPAERTLAGRPVEAAGWQHRW